jgi:hypothetical protein
MKHYRVSGSRIAAALVGATLIGMAGYYLVTVYANSVFPSGCNMEVGSSPESFALQTSGGSPAFVCVRLYYYNQNATLAINPASQVRIVGVHSGSFFDASKIFTIAANPSSVEIGGPLNKSEGAYVTYMITGSSNSNGKYTLNLGFLYPGGVLCSSEFTLLLGSGVPDYRDTGSCVLGLSAGQKVVLVEVVGASNATGY